MVTRMLLIASIAFAVMLPSASFAQGTALPTQGERRAADIASWVTMGALLALDVKDALEDRNDRTHKLQMVGVRFFSTWVMAELAKGLTERTRPDGSDDKSFYSQHTAHAFSTLGGPRLVVTLPLAFGTGGLRVAAGKHFITDVLVGAGVGALTSRIR